ncbi:MAG: His/Gly/Thr/Pro-type tRNA ligase C-terminal domain-containing protein [Candidatus Saccharibacteria bacterium]|nr:His/Gly/Thr/Pro-type tRNA ligase C-terminal domain-containing protein [Candidatus Saccharibacteria bacterium]
MRRSELFIKTSKTTPSNETAKNAQLLIKAGFVYKVMAGVYAYTPLGLRVLENIKQIVREEMNAVQGQELTMTSLQRPETWDATGRWDDEVVDVWFKTKLQDGNELGLAWSHEEAIMEMMQQFVHSYKDLPQSVYQFQTKLRNELRAKSGIMRGREFVMKDMYSLHATQEDCDQYYDEVIEAYKRCYERFGLGDSTFLTFAAGGAFTKFSHEFQTICDAGEDVLYANTDRTVAVNEEVLQDVETELGVDKASLSPVKSAEVGNIFKFGTEKSEQMGVYYTDRDGQKKPVYLASYGIGITRVMGVIVEKFADDKGLVWPAEVAPAKVYLVRIGGEKAVATADALYKELQAKGIEVIYDDREARPGEKFADGELMGIPYMVTVSDRLCDANQYELTARQGGEAQALTHEALFAILNQ